MHPFPHRPARCATILLLALSLCGCGTLVRKAAVRGMADMLAAPAGANVFASDNDPELVGDALPFALKTYELLLQQDPRNTDLAAATAAGFVQYANAYVQRASEDLEGRDYEQSRHLKQRAAALYARGRDYALQGLEARHPGFGDALRADPTGAVERLAKRDVPLAYWAGAGWAAATAADPADMDLVAQLPMAEALMRRVLALDEAFEDGAVHEFFISFEGGRSEAMGGSPERARRHFERAVELSRGLRASPYVALAESVAVREQDLPLFRKLLNEALAVDVDAEPKWRLANVLAQRKARRLLDHAEDLFVDFQEEQH